tara:strand:- start:7036 stop:7446 length:411 start_codon:yes stop_codon:yes gene_type:complete
VGLLSGENEYTEGDMPLFDQECPNCGVQEVLCSSERAVICEICGGPAKVLPSAFNLSGIIWSNTESSSQLGVTWNTNKEKREWFKRHPNVTPVSKGSPADTDFKNNIRQKADNLAKKAGFQNVQKFIKEKKKALPS